MPTFNPPTFDVAFGPTRGLNRYYSYARGTCVLVAGDVVTEQRYPWQGDLDDFDFVYLGGYDHQITDAEADVLTDAGYGEFIS